MVKVTFIRHGQTMWNVVHKFQGKTDIPLNTLGCHQASQILLSENYDMAYHSGLLRSKQTLDIIYKNNELNIPITKNILLQERCFGVFEGLTHDKAKYNYPDEYNSWCNSSDNIIPGAESELDVLQRILVFLISNNESNNSIIVTHGGCMQILYRWLFKIKPNEKSNLRIENCDIYTLDYNISDNNGKFNFEFYMKKNDIHHKDSLVLYKNIHNSNSTITTLGGF